MTIIVVTQCSKTNKRYLVSDQMVGDGYRTYTPISKLITCDNYVVGIAGAAYLINRDEISRMTKQECISHLLSLKEKLDNDNQINAIIGDETGFLTISGLKNQVLVAYGQSPGTGYYIGDLGWLISIQRDNCVNRTTQVLPEHDDVVRVIRTVQQAVTGIDTISIIPFQHQ